eukprot:GFKZ01016039.1.p1 GENE.GFKZ01016039.1~~GFKZ01016039.1.p1  ORF type:complete len:332 (+),score=43.94 GFKZ01016039.1:405-1400(+)
MAYPSSAPTSLALSKHRALFALVLSELRATVTAMRRARAAQPTPPPAVFILDWDDTCCPTTFLERAGFMADLDSRIDEFAPEEDRLLRILELRVLSLLKTVIRFGTLLIVTNAGDGWVELSSSRFLPAVKAFLDANYKSVKVISARERYVERFRDQPLQWKALTFVDELRAIYLRTRVRKQPLHALVLGDSIGDQYAAHIAANNLIAAGMPLVLKVVKFLERPTIDQLCKELGVLLDHIDAMHAHGDSFHVSMYKEPAPVVTQSPQIQTHYPQHEQQLTGRHGSAGAHAAPAAAHALRSRQHAAVSTPSARIPNSAVDTPVSAMATCPTVV